jgi:hypothetical protein
MLRAHQALATKTDTFGAHAQSDYQLAHCMNVSVGDVVPGSRSFDQVNRRWVWPGQADREVTIIGASTVASSCYF